MKDILHAKSVILEKFEVVVDEPLPPLAEICRDDDKAPINRLLR